MDEGNSEADLASTNDQSIFVVWEKFQEFEVCSMEGDSFNSIGDFLSEWQIRMCTALALGCQYSDTVLAFKVLEKANLDYQTIMDILSGLQYPALDSSLLTQTVQKIKTLQSAKSGNSKISVKKEDNDAEDKSLVTRTYVAKCTVYPDDNSVVTSIGIEPLPIVDAKFIEAVETTIDDLDCEDMSFPLWKSEQGDTLPDIVVDSSDKDIVIDTDLAFDAQSLDDAGEGHPLLENVLVEEQQHSLRNRVKEAAGETSDNRQRSKLKVSSYKRLRSRAKDDDESIADTDDDQISAAEKESESQLDAEVRCPRCQGDLEPVYDATSHSIEKYVCTLCSVMLFVNRSSDGKAEKPDPPKKVRKKAALNPTKNTGKVKSKCKFCNKEYANSWDLKVHQRSHFAEKPHKCPACSRRYKSNRDYIRHKKTHGKSTIYTCVDCNDDFYPVEQYLLHRSSHHSDNSLDLNDSRWICDVCHACFLRELDLELHSATQHSGNSFQCHFCGKYFKSSTRLKEHTRCHTDERPYSCTTCDRAFHSYANLRVHMRTHTGERPFACSECGKFFALKQTLIDHSRTHTGEKPFTCDDCGRSFAHNITLKNHKRIHTGERPFKCPVCEKAFPRKDRLKKHMTGHMSQSDLNEFNRNLIVQLLKQ